MKTWIVISLVCAVACSKQEGSGGGGGSGGGAAAKAIDLPAMIGKSAGGVAGRAMVFLDGKLVEVEPTEVFGSNAERGFRGFDAQGRLTPESGTWRPPASAPPPNAATVVVVDRGAKAAEVRAALAPLAGRCVGFLGKREGTIAALMPDPCPPQPDTDPDHVQLGVLVDKGRTVMAISKINEREELADRTKLLAMLRQYKASAFFADRKDIEIAFPKDATMGEVIELLDAVHGLGFTSPHWVDAAELAWVEQAANAPAEPAAPRTPSEPPKPVPLTMSIGQPNVQGSLDRAIIRRYLKHDTRSLELCYEKQLAGKPMPTGTVSVQFQIGGDGKVSSASGNGIDPAVASCIADAIRKIEFPKPKDGGKVLVNCPIVFRPGE